MATFINVGPLCWAVKRKYVGESGVLKKAGDVGAEPEACKEYLLYGSVALVFYLLPTSSFYLKENERTHVAKSTPAMHRVCLPTVVTEDRL